MATVGMRLGVAPRERRRGNPARRAELGLVVFGSLIVTAAYVVASIGTTAKVPAHLAVFLVIVLGVLIANFIADLLYVFLDPRIRLGGRS